ncbi:MAG: DsrE family protein [Dehalococcoidia bacterium]|nr:DsrE family protein [Dehalococcoidia bacterium]MDZ4246550.1 DsrE family protein [Dehalococcoidia bacterium]
MKLGIILNTPHPETAWNALRLGNEAIAGGHEVNLFLLGPGVELEKIKNESFNVPEVLKKFISSGGNLFACGTCLEIRHQEAGVCPISTMSQLVEIIAGSDKVVTLG